MSLHKILLFLFIFSGSACSLQAQLFYVSDNDINAMQFEKQGDLKISYSVATERRLNAHLAFSPIKHIVLSGGYLKHLDVKTNFYRTDIFAQGYNYNASIGLYKLLPTKSSSRSAIFRDLKGFLFQAHFGGSLNKTINSVADSDFHINTSGRNLFYRWSLFMKYEKLFFSYSARRTFQQYTDADVNVTNAAEPILLNRFEEVIGANPHHKYTERSLRFQFKVQYLDFYIEQSVLTSNVRTVSYDFLTKSTVYVGCIIDLKRLYEKISRKN